MLAVTACVVYKVNLQCYVEDSETIGCEAEKSPMPGSLRRGVELDEKLGVVLGIDHSNIP